MTAGRPTTFNLSEVYRALGMRDPRVIPDVAPGMLVPVIILGTFESFAAEVIEARGFVNQGPFNILAGQWVGLSHQSTAPGGTIIEELSCSDGSTLNMAPAAPFGAPAFFPFTTGGQPISSLFQVTGIQVGAAPNGFALGGTACNPLLASGARAIAATMWVPPGWWFWVILGAGTATAFANWRFREMPEQQGPI